MKTKITSTLKYLLNEAAMKLKVLLGFPPLFLTTHSATIPQL